MSKLSDKHCEVCLQKGIRKKVRTLCDECRELLCKECSDAHLLLKSSQYNLIDLDPPREELRSTDEDELASEFLENVAVSKSTVLYRAQVAVESESNIRKENESETKREMRAKTKLRNVDLSELKPKKVTEFSVKQHVISVNSVLGLNDKVIIVDSDMNKMTLYDSSGKYLSSASPKERTWGITHVNNDRFATCGDGKKVFLWTMRGQNIINEDEMYDVCCQTSEGIYYNNTFYCVLHRDDNAVTILDRQGRQVRKITMEKAFGGEIEFGWGIHIDGDTHDMYLPCRLIKTGVLCISVEGEALWFTPLSEASLWGITEVHGALCVADDKKYEQCIHLISKTGQYTGTLLDKNELAGHSRNIYYNKQEQKLYLSYYWFASICVYSV